MTAADRVNAHGTMGLGRWSVYINNGFWNYGSALALIMLVLIGITTLLSGEDNAREDETGGVI